MRTGHITRSNGHMGRGRNVYSPVSAGNVGLRRVRSELHCHTNTISRLCRHRRRHLRRHIPGLYCPLALSRRSAVPSMASAEGGRIEAPRRLVTPPQPIMGSGERHELLSGVRGGPPVGNAF